MKTIIKSYFHGCNTYLHTSLGTAGLSLLLFFSINLWGLTLDLTSTSQRTVDFTTKKSGLGADGGVWSNTNLFQSETSLDWGGENFTGWNLIFDLLLESGSI